MPTPTQSAIRCLHRRAVFAAGSLLLPVLAELLVVFRSAFPSAALSSQRVLLTLTVAMVTGDLLLLRVREERPEHLALGLVVPINIVLLAAVSLFSLAPLYGFPVIFWLLVERPVVLLLCLVPVIARVLVIRSAFEVHRVLLAGGHAGRWGTGLALSPGLLLVGLSPALAAVYLHWHPAPGPASAAVQAARAIQGCAQRFAADHGGRFPADLAALGPSGTGCLDASLAAGHVPNWSVTFHGGDRLTVVVRERALPLASYRSYVSDASGVLRTAGYATRDATASDPVLGNVTAELTPLRDCMLRLRQTGAQRLPGSLWSMSRWRSGCYVLNDARWRVDGDSNLAEVRTRFMDSGSSYEERYRYAYRPWFGADGRVDSAAIVARPAVYSVTGLRSYLLTPSGEIHATAQDRPATPMDPLAPACESYSLGACPRTQVSWLTVKPPSDSVAVPSVGAVWQAALAPRPVSGTFLRPPAPTIAPDGLIVATGQIGTYAYTADGAKRWSRPDIRVAQGGTALGPLYTILVTDSTGVLHALDRDGRDRWRTSLGVPTRFAPVVVRNTIYVAGDHTVFAVSTGGELRWKRSMDGLVNDFAAARDGGVYVDVWGDHTALEHITLDGRVDASIPRDSLRPCAAEGSASPLDACAGDFRARLDPAGGRRFALINQPEMASYVRDELLWTWQIGRDGTVFVARDGALRAVAPDLATRWRVPGFPSSIDYGAVAVTPGGYVVAASGRELSAYDRSGTARWTTDLHGDGWFSRPVVGPSGVLYVVDTKWTLYAVRPPDAKTTVSARPEQ